MFVIHAAVQYGHYGLITGSSILFPGFHRVNVHRGVDRGCLAGGSAVHLIVQGPLVRIAFIGWLSRAVGLYVIVGLCKGHVGVILQIGDEALGVLITLDQHQALARIRRRAAQQAAGFLRSGCRVLHGQQLLGLVGRCSASAKAVGIVEGCRAAVHIDNGLAGDIVHPGSAETGGCVIFLGQRRSWHGGQDQRQA